MRKPAIFKSEECVRAFAAARQTTSPWGTCLPSSSNSDWLNDECANRGVEGVEEPGDARLTMSFHSRSLGACGLGVGAPSVVTATLMKTTNGVPATYRPHA